MECCEAQVRELLAKRKVITECLFAKKEQLDELRTKVTAVPSPDWVLNLAENLTLTVRAPKDWAPGRPLHELGGHPPAPQFEQMRVGMLAELAEEFGHVSAATMFAAGEKRGADGEDAMNTSEVRGGDEEEEEEEEEEGDEEDDLSEGGEEEEEEERLAPPQQQLPPQPPPREEQAALEQAQAQASRPSRQVNINFLGGGDSDSEDDEE